MAVERRGNNYWIKTKHVLCKDSLPSNTVPATAKFVTVKLNEAEHVCWIKKDESYNQRSTVTQTQHKALINFRALTNCKGHFQEHLRVFKLFSELLAQLEWANVCVCVCVCVCVVHCILKTFVLNLENMYI